MGSAGGEWLQARSNITSGAEIPTFGHRDRQGRLGAGGDSESTGERGNKDSTQLPWPISQLHISGAQERWLIQTSNQPEATESVYGEPALQDGEPGNDERPAEEQRLDGLNRFEGCIPVSSSMGGPPEISSLPMAGQSVRIPVPPLWPVECAPCLHQAAETSVGTSAASRNTFDNVPGRYANDGSVQGRTGETVSPDHLSPRDTRVCHQQGEVPFAANTDNPVSRISDRLPGNENPVDRGEDDTGGSSMQEGTTGRIFQCGS